MNGTGNDNKGIKVAHTIRETVESDFVRDIEKFSISDKQAMLDGFEKRVYELQKELAQTIAKRDILHNMIVEKIAEPHWTLNARVATLHGEGARLQHCASCGKMTKWSYGGTPQCPQFENEIPVEPPSEINCKVEVGGKKYATRIERDMAHMMLQFSQEGTKSQRRKGKK